MATEAQDIMDEVKAMRADSEERAKELDMKQKEKYNELTGRLDELEVRMKRPAQGASGEKENPSKKAFFSYIRKGFSELTPDERKALVQGTTGDIIVPEDVEAEIYRELPTISGIRSLCKVVPTKSDRMRKISMSEVSVGWGVLEKSASLTESTLTPSEAFTYVEDLNGLTKIGVDELADTDQNLAALIASSFAGAFGEAEETKFIAGAGHASNEPEGILNASITSVDTSAANAVSVDDVIDLVYALPAKYHKGATLVMNTTTAKAVRKLKDTDGQYLWQPSIQAGQPPTMMGFPVMLQDDVEEIPSDSSAKKVMLFGQFRKGYRILDRAGMTLKRLDELYAESGLVGFLGVRRVGGSVVRTNAFRVLETATA